VGEKSNVSKFLKSRLSTTNALKLRRVTEKEKRRVPFKRLAADEAVVVVVPLVVLFLLSLSILVVVVTDIFFFAQDFKQPSSLFFFFFSHWMPPHVSNNKSFRLASSCALYIIRLILTRALRSTVVGVMLSLFPTKRRSGGSTLEEKLVVAGFFSQTLNPKRKRKISQKLNCNFQTHTHRNALKRFSYNTREEKYAHFSLEKDERILSAFVFLWCITHTRYKLCFFSARV